MTIWKYRIRVPDDSMDVSIAMPTGARILCLQWQDHQGPCLWVECEERNPETRRDFVVFGTGFELPLKTWNRRTYIGTWQERGLVWHLYEILPNVI